MNNKRKRLIIAGSSAAVIIIAVAAFVAWSLFLAPPSKVDFIKAKGDAEKIADIKGLTSLNEFARAVVAESKTKNQQALYDAVSDEKKKVVDDVNARRALANLLADNPVQRDDEVKKSYDTYEAVERRYAAYLNDYANVFPAHMSSFRTCIDVFQINGKATTAKDYSTLHTAATKDCLVDLNIVEKSPITSYASYAKEFKRIITERQKVFDQAAKTNILTKSDSNKINQLNIEYTKNDPNKDVRKYGDEAVFNGELTALIKLLDTKIKQS